jgi:hypothetical protein
MQLARLVMISATLCLCIYGLLYGSAFLDLTAATRLSLSSRAFARRSRLASLLFSCNAPTLPGFFFRICLVIFAALEGIGVVRLLAFTPGDGQWWGYVSVGRWKYLRICGQVRG